ncbi:MAG TPA: phage terminase large subunit, partial [Candidatus Kapabacteria bacterium]|nr:phage terminase large subunit [Candidatus Kapabacteria bacterium]
GVYQIPPHIAFIDTILYRISFSKKQRLIVCLPPRHGKSELISKYFPFWYLTTFSGKRLLLTSYEANFAAYWGRKVRALIDSYGKYFNVAISNEASAANFFELSNNSTMMTAGAGGALTGKGADLLIIDDPIKNAEEAHSPTIRQNIWDWFVSTAYSRLEPNGSCIIIMTRWHKQDLVGRLLEDFSSDWQLLKIPAIATSDDPLGRKPGEALWQERFPIDTLQQIQKQLGSYWFNALYQQEPSDTANSLFKRENFKYFKQIGDHVLLDGRSVDLTDCINFATADLAISTNHNADWSVFLVFSVTCEKSVLIRDIVRTRCQPTKHIEILRSLSVKYNVRLWGIEAVQYQSALVRQASSLGIPVKEIKPYSDKFTRAIPIAAMLEAGKIYFPDYSEWLSEFEQELSQFPDGKHDDQVDAFAYITEIYKENFDGQIIGKKVSRNVFTHF